MDEKETGVMELFTFGSTNGHKVAILLEELGLAYAANLVRPAVVRGVTIPKPLPRFPPRKRAHGPSAK